MKKENTKCKAFCGETSKEIVQRFSKNSLNIFVEKI
jgi:hypothetical protein